MHNKYVVRKPIFDSMMNLLRNTGLNEVQHCTCTPAFPQKQKKKEIASANCE